MYSTYRGIEILASGNLGVEVSRPFQLRLSGIGAAMSTFRRLPLSHYGRDTPDSLEVHGPTHAGTCAL